MRKLMLTAAAGLIASAFAVSAYAQNSAPDNLGQPGGRASDPASAAGRDSRDSPKTTTNSMGPNRGMTSKKRMSKKMMMKKKMMKNS